MNMKITTDKNKYNFYISYWESFKMLQTDKEKVEFMEIINKVHFFEEHIDNIKPKSKNVNLLFTSIKHSLKASIQGYCDKKNIAYNSMFSLPLDTPLATPLATISNKQLINNNKQLEINNDIKEKFNQFYAKYPLKKSKAGAETKFIALLKKEDVFIDIMKGLDKYIKSIEVNNTETQFIKHPTTWLHQRCWEDEYGKQALTGKARLLEGL